MKATQIGKLWKENFKISPLIKDGIFNWSIARQLYYGFDGETETHFTEGFCSFNDNFDYLDAENQIDKLIEYLHFVGIAIKKKSIIEAVAMGRSSYFQILKKAYYIFKYFARYDESLDINEPYNNNMGDFYFFLKIEEGNYIQDMQLNLFDELELPEFYNKYIEIPEGYENDKMANKLFNFIENSSESYFLTGKAGTGKSTFIQYFSRTTKKRVLLVAFTGIAAINIGGQTIHSFFRFPLKPLLPNDSDIKNF